MIKRYGLLLMLFWVTTTASAQPGVTVEITGVDGALLDNVRLFLSIEQQKNDALLSSGRIQRLHSKATHEIEAALQPFGYYRPDIDASLTLIDSEHWRARYRITPGDPIPIAKLDFVLTGEAVDDEAFQTLQTQLPLHEGDPLVQKRYEETKDELTQLATERGYFSSRFTSHRITIDLDHYRATVELHYDSGPRYRFGEVRFFQEDLDPELLQRFVPFKPGTPFSSDALIDLQNALNDSDYFQQVEIQPHPDSVTHQVHVEVDLVSRKRQRYTLGAGYGTDTGARAKLGWETPRINRYGHRADAEFKVSEIGNSFTARYRIPTGNPRTDQWVYNAGIINETTDTSESKVHTAAVSLFHARGGWRETLSLTYHQEKFTVANIQDDITLIMPGVNWGRVWADSRTYTHNGVRVDMNMRGTHESLGGDIAFFQGQAGLKVIHTLWPSGRLIGRGRAGTTQTDDFNRLPASIRFFTGGAQTVRGYPYQSLGPIDTSGKVIGGRHLMVGSLEYEQSLNDHWAMAIFYDVGNALNSFRDSLKKGSGVGLRWRSPIGPVRVDFAQALSKTDHPWRLHINIGPDL